MEALLSGPSGQTFLEFKVVTIGRMPTNQIVIANDNQVSGRHAEIRPNAQGYLLSDLGSVNGTFVNGQRLTPNVPYLLKVGDTIRVGQTTFLFEVRGAYQMNSFGQSPRLQQPPTWYPSLQGGSQLPPAYMPPQHHPQYSPTHLPPNWLDIERTRAAAGKSYTSAAVLTLFLYCLLYLPGLIVNIVYLGEAERTRKLTGQSPDGAGCLWVLLLTVNLPLLFSCGVMVLLPMLSAFLTATLR